MGFNDETCPPTSMYAAYNVISAPKELFIVPETGHWTYPEQRDKFNVCEQTQNEHGINIRPEKCNHMHFHTISANSVGQALREEVDICIYGGTSAVMAAYTAARLGKSVY
jgi:hypothetical protein